MHNLTRRGFLGWTTAGAAGIGLLSLVRHMGSSDNPRTSTEAQAPVSAAMSDPLVAYVHNPAGGEISLMVGTQEMIVHDPDLVSRLISRAVGR